MAGNFGDDSSDVEWSSFGKVAGNNGEDRDGVIVLIIGPLNGDAPSASGYYKYDADGKLMILPWWCKNISEAKVMGIL